MKYDYLVVGGGISGVVAAETIRANDPNKTILVIGDEPHIVYSRVLLPHYIKGKLERGKLFLREKSDFEIKKIDLILGRAVASLDAKNKIAVMDGGERVVCEKIIFATGGRAKKINTKGRDKKNIFYLQTLDDADAIKEALPEIRSAAVIGGGFIALEFLDIFSTAKIPAVLICRGNGIFSGAIEEAGSRLLEKIFLRHGIELIFNETVAEFLGDEKIEGVMTANGKKIPCDAAGLGIGLERNISFLSGSGLKTNNGILTDEYLRSKENIFAAGDIAEYHDWSINEQRLAGNWNSAFLQGKTAGLNASGKKTEFKSVTAYSTANLGFNLIFIGETKNFSESISRIDETKEKYERIFLLDSRAVGAALINMPEDRQKITSLIENRAAVKNFNDLDKA